MQLSHTPYSVMHMQSCVWCVWQFLKSYKTVPSLFLSHFNAIWKIFSTPLILFLVFNNQNVLLLQVPAPHGARSPRSSRHRNPSPGHCQPTGQTGATSWRWHHAHVSPANTKNIALKLVLSLLYQHFLTQQTSRYLCSPPLAIGGRCSANPLPAPCSLSLDVSR